MKTSKKVKFLKNGRGNSTNPVIALDVDGEERKEEKESMVC
jgi:hypothetical protein